MDPGEASDPYVTGVRQQSRLRSPDPHLGPQPGAIEGVSLGLPTLSTSPTKTKAGLTFTPPKTTKSRRVVALPKVTCGALSAHRTAPTEERLQKGRVHEDNDLVFPLEDDRPWDPVLGGPGVWRPPLPRDRQSCAGAHERPPRRTVGHPVARQPGAVYLVLICIAVLLSSLQ